MFEFRLSQMVGAIGTVGTIALLGWNSWPAMAQNRDTNPLCYFVDANGNRQDLTPWCGKTPAAPSNAVPSNAPNPSAPNSANPANGSAGKVTLASCRLANDANNAPNSRRRIVHLMGQVRNETGQPVQNVTVRYAIKSQGSLLERRGQMINEPVIAPDGMGVFDRRDQPMSIESVDGADNDWQAEVEAIEWVSNGQPNSYTLPTAQRCF